MIKTSSLTTPETPSVLTDSELLRFLKDPTKHYLATALQIRLDQLDWVEEHSDIESFEFDGLKNGARGSKSPNYGFLRNPAIPNSRPLRRI